jgi:hypothetical protein
MNLIQILKSKYYTYQPGEFLPIYVGGELTNRRQFHAYRLKWIWNHRRAALYQFTHYSG